MVEFVQTGFKGLVAQQEMDAFFQSAHKIGENKLATLKMQHSLYQIVTMYEARNWDGIFQIAKELKASPLEPQVKKLVILFEVAALLNSGEPAKGKSLYDDLQKEPECEVNPEMKGLFDQIESQIKDYFKKLEEKQASQREGLDNLFNELPEEPEALFEFYFMAVEKEAYDIALESLYKIIKKDKTWNDKKAHKAYLELLNNPNVDKALVKTYRNKLASLTM